MRIRPTPRRARIIEICLLLTLPAALASGQDTRIVHEPVVPPACARLQARLPIVNGKTIAAADENKPDTRRIQAALDHCPRGQAVDLEPSGDNAAFLTGPLALRAGVTLLVSRGTVLFGSRDPRDYDRWPGSCGTVTTAGGGCRALIHGNGVSGAAVMGHGVIDGRGWDTLTGSRASWWDLAQDAKVKNENQNCPRLINLTHCNNFTLYRITLKNAPMYHVFYSEGNGFTAWGVTIDSPKTARNTDGIDPSSATNVTITHCSIHAGDDDVSIKAGHDGPSAHISVIHNHFYTGHGMSIGSDTEGGVGYVVVHDLSIDGADNGLRIKSNISRGGDVHGVIYKNVCIRSTRNPVLMDSNYSFYGKARDEFPTFDGILLKNIHILNPGRITLDGYDAAHRLGMKLDNVILDDPAETRISAVHARIHLGPGPVNFRPSGDDVVVTGSPGQGKAYNCSGKFPPFPAQP